MRLAGTIATNRGEDSKLGGKGKFRSLATQSQGFGINSANGIFVPVERATARESEASEESELSSRNNGSNNVPGMARCQSSAYPRELLRLREARRSLILKINQDRRFPRTLQTFARSTRMTVRL